MLSILLTFVVLAISTYIIGRAVIIRVYGADKANCMFGFDSSIVLGLCLVTVYAGYFSIFAKVSIAAFLILILITLICAVYVLKKDNKIFPVFHIREYKIRYILVIVSILAVTLWTNITPQHYDTYLYHAQAIHWIEDYGVVKGLGNLHFRLAYNSAFMPLQALFSFKCLTGQSLHTVNGFATGAFVTYLVMTVGKKSRICVSDVIKVCSFLYIFYNANHISSPNTDTCALLMVLYIFIKWIEITENDKSDYLQYGFLCVLTVFATSLKLSAGIIVLFAIFPAYWFIKEKKIKYIIGHLVAGIGIITPYLIRNVIISGYLIYPYEKTGLNFVKWIMPRSILLSDRAEIVAWGRGNFDTSRNGEHIWQWIGDWYGGINILWKVVFPIALMAVIVLMVLIVREKLWKTDAAKMMAILSAIIGFVFWMLTAPLPRYGVVYMIILIGVAVGMILNKVSIKDRTVMAGLGAVIACYLVVFIGYSLYTKPLMGTVLNQADYSNRQTISNDVNGYTVYTPVEGDQTGYEPFPSAVNVNNQLCLTGNTIGEGFYNK